MSKINIDALTAKWTRLQQRAMNAYEYVTDGVWQDTRTLWWVSVVKVANLTVRGFMNGNLQNKACAMTYRTLLALVPMLALIFAIGRGFGLGDMLEKELLDYFPAQQRALEVGFRFVDSYIAQSSEGLFVGVGIVFLLWTLISLLSSVEEIFNQIWNVKVNRSMWRKLSDYTAILLILPVLMLCSSGIQMFMSSSLQRIFDFDFMTPVIGLILDGASVLLSWLFFAGCYALIPNTRVKIGPALLAGVFAGTGFQVVQWLFVTGQMYVAKYNAIYGSFSFLPLLLIWLQLVWLITFVCAGICYSSQNIFRYSFEGSIDRISITYRLKTVMAVLTVIVRRFAQGLEPLTVEQITATYGLPPRIVDEAVTVLVNSGLIVHSIDPKHPEHADLDALPLQPTHEPDYYKVGAMVSVLENHGADNFIPGFLERFAEVDYIIDQIDSHLSSGKDDIPLSTLKVDVSQTTLNGK